MASASLQSAIAAVPAGRWAVAVSGGADSVAMLRLLAHERSQLDLHVVHLDHETRGDASTGDAEFVRSLAATLQLPCTIAKRSEIEPTLAKLPANTSARYRAARLALFRRGVGENHLDGVILAHHADDQAETVFERLLRGSGAKGLTGMRSRARIGDLLILRPLLGVMRRDLREYLAALNQSWRDDASNTSDAYLRNRVRKILDASAALSAALLELSSACGEWKRWLREQSPTLPESFAIETLCRLPDPLRTEAATRWLIARGVPVEEVSAVVAARLVEMACDAATPSRRQFPSGVVVVRRRGMVSSRS